MHAPHISEQVVPFLLPQRDALLQAIIERAGYLDLIEVENAQHEQKQPLASLPQELAHFDLANLQDRPIQAQILELLLLHREDRRFTSCVLIHGMGGTGKTVTAVAGKKLSLRVISPSGAHSSFFF